MNTNQVKGIAKNAAGKVQETVGKVIDSDSQKAKGLAKQVSGKVEEKFGDAKEAAKDFNKSVKETIANSDV